MSKKSLKSQLQEDYLTCPMCFNSFIKPKALPCLHTYCEGCLRDYVVSRNYESLGAFPCPVCRINTVMPEVGVEGFPNNHIMSSLSDTVANSEEAARPKPKPRRSLGQPQVQIEKDREKQLLPFSNVGDDDDNHDDINIHNDGDHNQSHKIKNSQLPKVTSCDTEPDWEIVPNSTPSPWEIVPNSTPSAPALHNNDEDKHNFASGGGSTASQSHDSSNVAKMKCFDGATNSTSTDTISQAGGQATFLSDHLIAPVQPPAYTTHPEFSVPSYPQPFVVATTGGIPESATSYGWNINMLGDSSLSRPVNPESASKGNYDTRSFTSQDASASHVTNHGSQKTSQPLYPAVPTQAEHANVACTENLLLRFGKQGSSIRDFLKPVGLAVSKEGSYVVSDSSGDQNRIFIFNSGGELISAFNCGCKVKDVTMTKGNEILAAVHKNVSGIRHFTMSGQCKGEYGKFFTFEEPCGIGQLGNGGVAISGTQNHCVYVLTDQMKLSTKFGRKGNGDGYFQHPAFIAVDSKSNIIVTDKINNCVQIFTSDGKFRHRFGTSGRNHGQLQSPLGICVDDNNNVIVADSGNYRVEIFSPKGQWLRSVVTNTHELGNEVKPVNVAFTPTGAIAVLLRGPYFAEVRVYSSKHKHLVPKEGLVSTILSSTSAIWYSE